MKNHINNTAKICVSAILLFVFTPIASLAEPCCTLCKAVNTGNFTKVEKIVKKQILKHKYGRIISNGSASYTSYTDAYDSIVSWLHKNECVTAATWDKCQIKILLYPGHAAIGAIFKSPKGEVEKIFLIREGKSGRHPIKSKERFYYLEMKDGSGFVAQQLELCEVEKNGHQADLEPPEPDYINSSEELIPYENLLGNFVSTNSSIIKDTVTFRLKEEYHIVLLTRTDEKQAEYRFRNLEPGWITSIGNYNPWYVQIAKVEILSTDSIKITYSTSDDFQKAITITYRKYLN